MQHYTIQWMLQYGWDANDGSAWIKHSTCKAVTDAKLNMQLLYAFHYEYIEGKFYVAYKHHVQFMPFHVWAHLSY
jgi:hypothetical protein